MRRETFLFALASLLFGGVDDIQGSTFSSALIQAASCVITAPNGVRALIEAPPPVGNLSNSYGNTQISVSGLWPNGVVVFKPGGPGFITRSGSLGMKFLWWLGVQGEFVIKGRRLDATAPSLRSEFTPGSGGLKPSYLIFPTPGCWEITGEVASASITFVTKVEKIGNGPSWHRDVP